jgi:hypothetical protein
MMGIPVIGWVAATLGYYARDLLAPGARPPAQAPYPTPQVAPPPYYPPPQYAQPYGPPAGYAMPPQGAPSMGPGFAPPQYAPPQYAPPPRRWHAPFPLDAHMDERTDIAVARALAGADAQTLRGFAQAIERVFPIGAGVLRTRAWQLDSGGAGGAQPPQGFAPPQAPAPAAPQGPPNEQPSAPADQVQNYAQLLQDMVASGAADAAAAAPPPPAVKPEPEPAPKPRRRVVSVTAGDTAKAIVDASREPHVNGAAPPAAAAAPSPAPNPPHVEG